MTTEAETLAAIAKKIHDHGYAPIDGLVDSLTKSHDLKLSNINKTGEIAVTIVGLTHKTKTADRRIALVNWANKARRTVKDMAA